MTHLVLTAAHLADLPTHLLRAVADGLNREYPARDQFPPDLHGEALRQRMLTWLTKYGVDGFRVTPEATR